MQIDLLNLENYDVFSDTLKVWNADKREEKYLYTAYMGQQMLHLAKPGLFYMFDGTCQIPSFQFLPTRPDRYTPQWSPSENKTDTRGDYLNESLTHTWLIGGNSYSPLRLISWKSDF
jgi:hypothetical protein